MAKRAPNFRRVRLIVNPASGSPQPVLHDVDAALTAAGVDWDVAVTLHPGDALSHALRAVDDRVDAVAVCGGNGTLAEAVEALAGTGVPLAVLPGGTGNGFAGELGIAASIREAASLLATAPMRLRKVDLGRVGERMLLLRAGAGWIAETGIAASRDFKQQAGPLAYMVGALQALAEAPAVTYRVTVDGAVHEATGYTCLVMNGASVGTTGIRLLDKVAVDDGVLDVVVLAQMDLAQILSALAALTGAGDIPSERWRGREIRVEADIEQQVVVDGEPAGTTPFEVKVEPAALTVVVPK